jgi:hypothetical protein
MWQNTHSQLLYPKEYREEKYLPPYDPNVVIISPDVEKWMNEQLSKESEKRTVDLKTDVLGRVKSSSDKTGREIKVVESKQKRLVVISDMHIPQIEMEPMHGRSEYDSETKGYNYYLNGKKVSLKEYENLMEKHWKKFDSQNKGKRNLTIPGVISSDSRIWTAWMTAEEISALAKNYNELAIDDYIEPIDEAPVANILNTLQITTHAFPNNYTGYGVGVGVVEVNCRDTSIPIKYINNYTNYCGTSPTSTHHSRVVNVLQHASPDAHVFGFKSSTPHPDPDSYSPPLQVVTHSYGSATSNLYDAKDRDMDNYIYTKRIIGFKSAGNTGTNITSPGKALNIITVGAVCPAVPCKEDQNNITNGYTSYSSRWNSEIGNEKPEQGMYTDIDMGIYGFINGTSAAAPLLAGTMASLLDECLFCRRQPAMMKTALINSEKIPIKNASDWDSDNDKSAQGIVDFSTLAWGAGGAWWNGGNSSFFDSNNEIIFIENNVNAGRRHKITISWLSEGTYVYNNKKIQQDLDLYVYQNNQRLDYSSSWDNPFETVEFVAPTSDPLRVVIRRYRNGNNGNNGGNVILGYNIKYL